MVLPFQYTLGTVVSFRYTAPTANDRMPMVLVLASRHSDGYMHGVNLRYITPIQVQQLQYYFMSPLQRVKSYVNPFKQDMVQKYQQQQERQEYLAQQQAQNENEQVEGYVVSPSPDKSTFGVSTFTRTVGAAVRQIGRAFGRLSRYTPFGGKQEPQEPPQIPPNFANLNKFTAPKISDPKTFYYNYVKPILGPQTKNAYRKYKPQHIQNLRIIKGVTRDGTSEQNF